MRTSFWLLTATCCVKSKKPICDHATIMRDGPPNFLGAPHRRRNACGAGRTEVANTLELKRRAIAKSNLREPDQIIRSDYAHLTPMNVRQCGDSCDGSAMVRSCTVDSIHVYTLVRSDSLTGKPSDLQSIRPLPWYSTHSRSTFSHSAPLTSRSRSN